ncbi:MAG: DUF1015 domain-containing protein [Deltaproteobacteria bacterium]|nr:DUF1015 domain-containing protein [Deltaproteobacteria bacterium]
MAIVAPFKGLTYDYSERSDFDALVAPPYDVISEEEQEAYYQTDPHNVIRLVLGRKKTGDSDWDNRYTRAADDFKRWESEGVIFRADSPHMYVTSLTYTPGNGEALRTRWGIIALVRIEDEDSAVILPHERTFSAHKEDRLKLMRACNAQLSPVFSLYEDPDKAIIHSLRKVIDFPPEISFDLHDGTNHCMWIIQNPRLFKRVSDAMKDKSILIADGHHRYETARNFRNLMRARYGRQPDRSYEYVMMYLSNMHDEGLAILPSHRLIKNVPDFALEPFLEKIRTWFHITKFPCSEDDVSKGCPALKQRLEHEGRGDSAIAFYWNKAGQIYLFALREGARGEMGDDLDASLKKLDVLVLSRFILQSALGFTKEDLDNEEIFHYQSSFKTALSEVGSGNYDMAFLLNPTKMDQVKEVTGNSLVMPRKSTYFYPKVLTGLVFNKIIPNEIIHVP